MTQPGDRLNQAIEDGSVRVGVIGLGYVGLPLALAFAAKGIATTGFDIDDAKVAALNAGGSYIGHIAGARVGEAIDAGTLRATSDFAELANVDAILICVPTPLTEAREPDLRFVISTVEAIAPYLRAGHLVILESTTYPGTTREVVKPILEAGGLKSGQDFFLGYAPEREDPGNAAHAAGTIPKVVSGDGEEALKLVRALYDRVVAETVPVASMDVAEAAKLTENVFRAVNIALVNELKTIFAKMDIDIWEVIAAAKTKPFGFMPFYPGPGLGGHCIPIDPYYLAWRAREVGEEARFIELAGAVNWDMPGKVVDALAAALEARAGRMLEGRALKGAKVLVIGLAYKKNVDDTRESPAFRLIEILEARGADAAYHDPHIAEIPPTRDHAALAGRQSVPLTADNLAGFDAAIICTDHDAIDYDALVAGSRLVVDTRNATAGLKAGRAKIVKA